jgi:hypothetical protein
MLSGTRSPNFALKLRMRSVLCFSVVPRHLLLAFLAVRSAIQRAVS